MIIKLFCCTYRSEINKKKNVFFVSFPVQPEQLEPFCWTLRYPCCTVKYSATKHILHTTELIGNADLPEIFFFDGLGNPLLPQNKVYFPASLRLEIPFLIFLVYLPFWRYRTQSTLTTH